MLADLYSMNGNIKAAITESDEVVRLDPQNADIRITLGDLDWNLGKIDDAEKMYSEASQVDAKNPLPHDRLQKLYTAKKKYGPALEHMLQAKILKASGEPDDAARYQGVAGILQSEFTLVAGILESTRAEYARDKITRDDYYRECKEAAARIDALAGFLSTQTAPAQFKEANKHGVLAVNLLAQAAGYTVSYLETEKQHYIDESDVQATEAKTELTLFSNALRK